MTHQSTTLPSGLTVVTSEMPHMASVSLGVWVGVGGRHEPAALSGVSHFIEHMLFKGTRRRTARQISQDVEGIGGYLNAFTSEETTCFYSKARHDRFDELLDVLMDMFLNSTFNPAELDKERNVIKEELAMYLDQPHHHVQELLNQTLWPDHPLGRSLTGTEQTLDAMNRRSLMAYQRSRYLAGGTVVAAAGNIRHETVVRAVRRHASRIPAGDRPAFDAAPKLTPGPRLRLFTKETEQTQVAIGLPICSRHDPRRFALRVLNALLGENMSSRLFQVVREDHGLAYSIASSLGFFDDTGVLNISAGLETDNLPKALKLVARELRRCVRTKPIPAELRRARDYILGQLDLSLENTENQMMWVAEQWLGHRETMNPETVKRHLAAVTAEQVHGVARDFLRPDRIHLALVSPRDSIKGLAECLA